MGVEVWGRIVRLLKLPRSWYFVGATCSIFSVLAAGASRDSATYPDYVFEDGYSLMPLGEFERLSLGEGPCPRSLAKKKPESVVVSTLANCRFNCSTRYRN